LKNSSSDRVRHISFLASENDVSLVVVLVVVVFSWRVSLAPFLDESKSPARATLNKTTH
jgi:hypothetical protein